MDVSEFDGLMKLLREDQSTASEAESATFYEQFKRKKKVCQQSDVRAFGQIIFSLLAHTDLEATPDKGLLLADLVQNCSFTFTNWQHVQSHIYFESLEEKAAGERSPGSTDASEKKFEAEEAKEIVGDVETAPLNDSITYEEVADSQHDDEADRTDHQDKNTIQSIQHQQDPDDFMGQAALVLVEKGQASRVMADLENLLETGYAELIKSELLSQGDDGTVQENGLQE